MHLLKQKSKPTVVGKKRKKYNLMGSLDEFKTQRKSKEFEEAQQIPQEMINQGSDVQIHDLENVKVKRGKKE